ncbi:MAG: UDP-N-acetylmuramoyl-tripeptide--D-alanyl-D-alanine ligase [Anaerolineae bacterium]
MTRALMVSDILMGLGGLLPDSARQKDRPIAGVVIDSRQAGAGTLFVALKGERDDGHNYVGDAFRNGAMMALVDHVVDVPAPVVDLRQPAEAVELSIPCCLLVDNTLEALQRLAAYWRSQFDVRVVGITGSVGKSTTKEMVWSVLRRRFRTLRSEGNYNNEIGLPLTLLRLDDTHERVVLEMGMYALGEIRQLAQIARPVIGVVTNVGPTHLERLGSIERIARAKRELVESLPADGFAVLNKDDPLVCAMAECTPARVFYYGLDPSADVWASDIESRGLEGISFRLHYRGETLHIRIPLLGRHSVHTALAAAAVGLIEGESWEEIVTGLQDTSAHIRLVATPGMNDSIILDDTYNASPASSLAALNLLAELDGRRIAVLGDMLELGDYEEVGHRKVGLRARDVAAKLIAVGWRARLIAEEALSAGMPAADVYSVDTNQEAIELLRSIVQPGDIILVKGSRGMKMEEIVAALGRPAWPTR